MSGEAEAVTQGWAFFRFALFVTGKGERDFLPRLFRPLEDDGHCHFRVVHQLGQRGPIRSEARRLRMVGRGEIIPDRDEDLGLKARKVLSEGFHFVLLVDDLEQARAEEAQEVYDRYWQALDVMLAPREMQGRASVHFLVNMLEAYYFAHAEAVNAVLGTDLADYEGDVETIPHPKNRLKKTVAALGPGRSFDEVRDGKLIMDRLDVEKILSGPDTCRSLRTAFAWCHRAKGLRPTERFRLADGQLSPITAPQLDRLPPVAE